MRVILLITVGDPQLPVAGWLATKVNATNVLLIQRDKKLKNCGGGFHNHVNVPRKLISSHCVLVLTKISFSQNTEQYIQLCKDCCMFQFQVTIVVDTEG